MRPKTLKKLIFITTTLTLFLSFHLSGCKKDLFNHLPDCDTLNCKCGQDYRDQEVKVFRNGSFSPEFQEDVKACGTPKYDRKHGADGTPGPPKDDSDKYDTLRPWCAYNDWVEQCTFRCSYADSEEECKAFEDEAHNCKWFSKDVRLPSLPYCGAALDKLGNRSDFGSNYAHSKGTVEFSSFGTAFGIINRVLNAQTAKGMNVIQEILPAFGLPELLTLPDNFQIKFPVPVMGNVIIDKFSFFKYDNITNLTILPDMDNPNVLLIGVSLNEIGINCRVRALGRTIVKVKLLIKDLRILDPPLSMKMKISTNVIEKCLVGQFFSSACFIQIFEEYPAIGKFKYKASGIKLSGLGALNGFASAIATGLRNFGNKFNLPKYINPAIEKQFVQSAKGDCPFYDINGPYVPYIGWKSPFFIFVYNLIDNIFGVDPKKSKAGFTINNLIETILDNTEGRISVENLFNSFVPVSNGMTLMINISELSVSGLNTFEKFEIEAIEGRGQGLRDTRAEQMGLYSKYDQYKKEGYTPPEIQLNAENGMESNGILSKKKAKKASKEIKTTNKMHESLHRFAEAAFVEKTQSVAKTVQAEFLDNENWTIIDGITNYLGNLFVGGQDATSVKWKLQLEKLDFDLKVHLAVNHSNGSVYMDDKLDFGINLFKPAEKNNLDALVSAEPFAGMQIGQIPIQPFCTAKVVRNASLSNMIFSVRKMNMTLECDPDHCTTEEFRSLGELWKKPKALQQMNEVLRDITKLLNKKNSSLPAGSALAWGLSNSITVGLNLAESMCNGSYVPPAEPDSFDGTSPLLQWLFFWMFVGFCATGIFLAVVMWCFMRDDEDVHYKPITKPEDALALRWHPAVPQGLRTGLPVFTFGSLFLFAASNASPGAGVNVFVALAGLEKIQLPTVFQFALIETVKDMWKASAYPLAIFIGAFSGVWAYLKMILLLLCWVLPPSVMSPRTRGRCLEALDLLGKWCLIDLFFMTLNMCAFGMHIDSSVAWDNVYVLPKQFFILDVVLTPEFGVTTFIFAAVLSIICGHIMLHYHRRASALDALTDDERSAAIVSIRMKRMTQSITHENSPHQRGIRQHWEHILAMSENLCSHKFRSNTELGYIQFTLWGKLFVAFFLLLVAAGLCVGMFEVIFSMEVSGLAKGFIGDAQFREFSAWDIGTNVIPKYTEANAQFYIMMIFYFIFVFVAPLVQVLFLVVMWLVPLTLRWQRVLHVATEVMTSWSALDVLMVAFIAAIFQLSKVVALFVDQKCDYVQYLLRTFLAETFKNEIPPCFAVSSKLLPMSALLFAVVIFMNINTQMILRTNTVAMQDRAEKQAYARREVQVLIRETSSRIIKKPQPQRQPTKHFIGRKTEFHQIPTPISPVKEMSPTDSDVSIEYEQLGARRVRLNSQENLIKEYEKDEDEENHLQKQKSIKTNILLHLSVSRLKQLSKKRLGKWGRVTSHWLRMVAQFFGMVKFTKLPDHCNVHTFQPESKLLGTIQEDLENDELDSDEENFIAENLERTLSTENMLFLGSIEPKIVDPEDDIMMMELANNEDLMQGEVKSSPSSGSVKTSRGKREGQKSVYHKLQNR